MAVTAAGSALVCTGTTSIDGPIDVQSILNNATTSFSITKVGSAGVIASGAAASAVILPIHFRTSSDITVTVTGGGSITLYLRVQSER